MRAEPRIPFAAVSQRVRQRALLALMGLTVVVGLIVARLGTGLAVAAAPNGIVSFELAGTAAEAQRILSAWGPALSDAARTQTWVDFIYLATYAPMLALAAGLAAGTWAKRGALYAWAGTVASWGALAAGALDCVENLAMLSVFAAPSDALAALARACAIGKFTLIFVAIIYALFGAALWITDNIVAIGKRWYRSVVNAPDEP